LGGGAEAQWRAAKALGGGADDGDAMLCHLSLLVVLPGRTMLRRSSPSSSWHLKMGFFVLNDAFRYVDEADQQQQQQPENQVSTNVPEVPLSHEDVMKENVAAPFSAPSARPAPMIPPRQTPTVATSSLAPEVPASGSHGAESGDVQEAEVDGHSIYIKNLPLNATVVQLEEEFKRFGPIRPDGIQVRSNKQQGFCFGFVEFEVPSAVQSAIEAPPYPNHAIEAREAKRDDDEDEDLCIHDD
ncbi:hypothetical protein Taro_044756, partial [Colocasia esculenta]|nr:hypothetical protein [Colocasia esculenta]